METVEVAPPPRPKYIPRWLITFYQSMTVVERVSLVILIILLIISGVFSVINYVNVHTQLIPQKGGIYREAAVGQPRHINPILATANDLDVDISRLIYSGLFRYNNNLELENDLATNVEISANKTEYLIKIRNDVMWHDGLPLTAGDIVFTIRSIQTPDYASPLAPSFQGVTIEQIDDFTVKFILPQPYAPFLSSLTVGIVPEHVWSEIEPQNATLTEQILKPVGTGPFRFAEISTRRRTGDITNFRLIRNENYYRQSPYLDEIIFTFYTSHEEALQALRSGNADGIGFIPLQMVQETDIKEYATIHQLLLPQYFALFFNQQNNEILSENGVRSALALAVDRQELVDQALGSQGEPVHLPIPPGTLHHGGEILLASVDIEKAKQNLSESGWEEGEDGIREKAGKKLRFKITSTDWPEYIKTTELLQRQWRAIGIDVSLEHLSAGTIQQTSVQPRDYEALLFGEILPADPDPYPFWHSTQTRSPGLNLSLFKNQDVDKLLEEARKEPDATLRAEKYQEFQNKILELNPAIILYRPYYLFASRGVRGIDSNLAALPADRFNNSENWHINTKRVWK